jgi:hypothetical protein
VQWREARNLFMFWSEAKRLPMVIVITAINPYHLLPCQQRLPGENPEEDDNENDAAAPC